jgi:hypothetical protein
VLTAAAQAKKDKADADRQAALDRAAAVTGSLANAKTSAEITGLANTAAHQKNEDASKGYGLTPPVMPGQQPGKPPPSNRDYANYYSELGAFYTKNGALEGAATAGKLAEQYGTIADKQDAGALALRKEANTEIETQALIHHWTKQEKQAAQDAANRLSIAAGHDATTMAAAQARVAGMISAANIAADSRLKVGREGQAGALLRERETQRGENARAAGVQTGANTRAAGVQAGATQRANITHGEKGAKSRSLTPEQAAAIKLKATSLIQGGMTKADVTSQLVNVYNLSPDQADDIVAEPDDE